MSAPTIPPSVWADLLADQLAETDRARVAALQEAESYRTCYLQVLRVLSAERRAHDARCATSDDAVRVVLEAAGLSSDASLDHSQVGVAKIARDYLVAQEDAARARQRAFAAEARARKLQEQLGEIPREAA